MAGYLVLIALGALVWSVGFSYFIRKSKLLAIAGLLLSAAIWLWALHYHGQLSAMKELTADLQWHQLYMIWILILVPVSLVVGGILGVVLHQKAYLAQYSDLEKGPPK